MPIVDVVDNSARGSNEQAGTTASSGAAAAEEAGKTLMTVAAARDWSSRIQELKKQQEDMKASKQALAKELKASKRKWRRLKERARCLSEDDMVNILMMKRAKSGDAMSPRGQSTGGSQSSGSGAASTTASDLEAPRGEDAP